jgi:hypothetical protein
MSLAQPMSLERPMSVLQQSGGYPGGAAALAAEIQVVRERISKATETMDFELCIELKVKGMCARACVCACA